MLEELATEFDIDAELVERLANIYALKGMNLQYEVLWHEGAVYRSCADRMRSAMQDTPGPQPPDVPWPGETK